MPKFRKKPVEIEAMLWDGSIRSADEIETWSGGASNCRIPVSLATDQNRLKYASKIFIKTLEGEMCADQGDWIIRGVKGEFYPCKPDIFAATYEAV